VLAALPSTGVAVTFSRYNYDLIGGTTFLRNNLRLLLHTLRERETFLLDKKEKVSFAGAAKESSLLLHVVVYLQRVWFLSFLHSTLSRSSNKSATFFCAAPAPDRKGCCAERCRV